VEPDCPLFFAFFAFTNKSHNTRNHPGNSFGPELALRLGGNAMNLTCHSDVHPSALSFSPGTHATCFDQHLPKLPLYEALQLCLEFPTNESLWADFNRLSRTFIAAVIRKNTRSWTTPTSALVEDLVQETYLKLCAKDFKALREFDYEHDSALYGFLKVVSSNVVHDYFRSAYSKKRGCGREEEDLEQVPMSTDFCSRSFEDADRRILLDEIDDCLADRAEDPAFARDYAIFWLYYREGLSARAISRLPSIHLTVKGVESVLNRLTCFVRVRLNALPPRRMLAKSSFSS
jgi:RNA polymerase sigma-70 factor (ECF subfamily)